MAKIAKEIQSLFVKHLGKKIYIKEIKAMLVYLLDNYASVSYEKKLLTVRTEEIYSKGSNYGSADIKIDLKILGKRDCHYYALHIYPTNCSDHVYSSGGLCFGEGWWASAKSLQEGRLDDFVDIVQQILRT